jgi:uncharacterized protein (TIGR01777 family)
MNYLITGATGFIGKHLLNRLLEQEHSVVYLARKRDTGIDSRTAFFQWDSEREPPLEVAGRLDAIVHLAGEPVSQRWTPAVKARIRDSRILGTRRLVAAIAKLKRRPSVLVSASALGYYGDQGDRLLPETAEPGTGFLSELCQAWEHEALQARDLGVRVASIRISIVLGPNGGALGQMARPFRFGLGGTLGTGNQWMSWIHLDDLVTLLQFVAENAAIEGPVNAATGAPVTNREFTRELAAVLHRPAPLRIPRFALRLATGEIADSLLASTRLVPQVAEAHAFTFRYPHLRDALENCFTADSTHSGSTSK